MAVSWRQNYLRYRQYFLNTLTVYKKRKDFKMFLEVLLSLTAIAIFGSFALRPTALTIVQLINDTKAKQEVIVQMDQKITDLAVANNLYSQELSRITLLDTAIPDSPQPEVFIRQTEGVVNKNGVELIGSSIGEVVLAGEDESPPEEASELVVSITASGEWPALVSFLGDLENLRRPLAVNSASVNSVEKKEGNTIVLAISALLPYLKND